MKKTAFDILRFIFHSLSSILPVSKFSHQISFLPGIIHVFLFFRMSLKRYKLRSKLRSKQTLLYFTVLLLLDIRYLQFVRLMNYQILFICFKTNCLLSESYDGKQNPLKKINNQIKKNCSPHFQSFVLCKCCIFRKYSFRHNKGKLPFSLDEFQ